MARPSVSVGSDIHDAVAEQLKLRQQRYTSLRRLLVDVLGGAEHPLTIQDLQRAAKGVALSSLYRNLAILEKCALVIRVTPSSGPALYELAESISEHHHHLVCMECGAVRDVVLPETIEHGLDRQLAELARKEGYMFLHHQLDVMGTCNNCQHEPM